MGLNSKNAYVTLNDTVEKALELMIKLDLVTIPVINEEKNIIEDITLQKFYPKY